MMCVLSKMSAVGRSSKGLILFTEIEEEVLGEVWSGRK